MTEEAWTRALLDAWTAGEISSPIAVMELLLETRDPDAAARCIEQAADGAGPAHYHELLRLIVDHRDGCNRAISIARRFDEVPMPAGIAERIASTKDRFDEAVSECEEASVALYSLGDPRMLRAATDEVTEMMRGWNLLGKTRDVLQIGCGIGRFEVALAPHVRRAVGIDVSPKMIAAARRRAADVANVTFDVCNGLDLAAFADGSFDLVYAVDSMPYIVDAGPELVEAHFREAARVLRDHGEFAIFGFSYRRDADEDRVDIRRLSSEHGFELACDGTSPFALWNGRVFRMRRRGRMNPQGRG